MLFERYGARPTGRIYRSKGWQRQLRAKQLPLGDAAGAIQQHLHKQHAYLRRQNADAIHVGHGSRREGQHPFVPTASRHAARASASQGCWVCRFNSGCCSRASVCSVRSSLHPAACASSRWPWALLLSGLPWEGAPQHLTLMGLHGQRRMWAIKKMDEVDALAVTVERLLA